MRAEIDYDHQHGPIVRVTLGDKAIAVYLADETAVVTTLSGQCGLEVKGPWRDFWTGIEDMRKEREGK